MTAEHYESNVKSNVCRKAKSLGLDLSTIRTIEKAGKKFYRLPLTKSAPAKAPAKQKAEKQKAANRPSGRKPKGQTALNEVAGVAPKPTGAKFEQVAVMLRKDGGASIETVCKATEWLPHTARARISVNVSKLLKKGETIERRFEGKGKDKVSWYAIVKSRQQELPGV